MALFPCRCLALGFLLVLLAPAQSPATQAAEPNQPLAEFQAALPPTLPDLSEKQVQSLTAAAQELEDWAAEIGIPKNPPGGNANPPPRPPGEILANVRRLLDADRQVDAALLAVLQLRGRLAALPDNEPRREKIRLFLRTASQLIDLAGRLRYVLRDAIDVAAVQLDATPADFDRLLDLLIEKQSAIGAAAMSYALFPPPPESGAEPYPLATRSKVLKLISVVRQAEFIPVLADLVRQEADPRMRLAAADMIRYLGLPQSPRPGSDPTLPKPAIEAAELIQLLQPLAAAGLSADAAQRHADLLAWLKDRQQHGVREDSYRIGDFDVREGDWLLMRNPSPYNLFTDLSPGLFTHVGVVGVETGADGIRRFVLVDLPERGATIPATNVDLYVTRTLHYFFLRHREPEVGRKMGQAAVAMIDNPTEFDLTFKTSRVDALVGKDLNRQRIHTYCAGFLLICAGQTGLPRTDFFPIAERPAGGRTLDNLAKLKLSIGDRFVSPTGAIFSPNLEIVGRCQPTYHPGREVKEAIYDHFAERMQAAELTPAPTTYQALREKLAVISANNPLLRKLLADANNASEHMDLVAAAKAAAVIETLDEIADAGKDGYYGAWQALTEFQPIGPLPPPGVPPSDEEKLLVEFRRRHANLLPPLVNGQLSLRDLRVRLVQFYSQQGRDQLDAKFFPRR